jgi:hypothetical protein
MHRFDGSHDPVLLAELKTRVTRLNVAPNRPTRSAEKALGFTDTKQYGGTLLRGVVSMTAVVPSGRPRAIPALSHSAMLMTWVWLVQPPEPTKTYGARRPYMPGESGGMGGTLGGALGGVIVTAQRHMRSDEQGAPYRRSPVGSCAQSGTPKKSDPLPKLHSSGCDAPGMENSADVVEEGGLLSYCKRCADAVQQ